MKEPSLLLTALVTRYLINVAQYVFEVLGRSGLKLTKEELIHTFKSFRGSKQVESKLIIPN